MRNTISIFEKQLNDVSLYGLEGIESGSALRYKFYEDKTILTANYLYARALVRILRASFTIAVDRRKNNNIVKIVMLYTNSYRGRADYMEWFRKIADQLPDTMKITPGKRRIYLGNIRYLTYYFRWLYQVRRIKDQKRKIVYLSMLYEGFIDFEYIKQGIPETARIVASVSDGHLIDSLVVQYFNRQDMDTATFEHGLSGEGNDDGYLYSKSRHYLAQGEFSRRHAIKVGMKPEYVYSLGIPKLVGQGKPQMKLHRNPRKAVAVFFCGDKYYEDDLILLDMVLEWNQNRHYKIYVKLHPEFGQEYYDYDKWEQVERIYDERISAEKLAKEVKFSVTVGSSVFADFTAFMYPVMVYLGRYKIYEDVKNCTFRTFEGLCEWIDELLNNPERFEEKTLYNRNDFCREGDVADNYYKFFSKYIEA